MGTISVEEVPKGCLYLDRRVFEEFDAVKSQTNNDTNGLLEHLITLYCEQAGETKGLPVRLDLALKFISLQALTPFESSNDLMAHLLSVHASHEKTREPVTQGIEKTDRSRPKKNKRKPDFVQRKPFPISTKNSTIDVDISNSRSRSPSVSFSEDSGCFDTSKEEIKAAPNGTSCDTSGPYTEMTGLDLSVVKKEKENEYRSGSKRVKLETSSANDKKPFTLHPMEMVDNQARSAEFESPVSGNAQINFQQSWRSNSVPVGDYNPSISPKQPLSLQSSPQGFISETFAQNSNHVIDKKNRFGRVGSPINVDALDTEDKTIEEVGTEDYNYVLTGLDSPENQVDIEGVSPIPMKMPVKLPVADNIPFPNSTQHSSSPEDLSLTVPLRIVEDQEPQDLTSPQKSIQSKPEIVAQSSIPPPLHGPGVKQNLGPKMPPLTQGNRQIAPATFKQPKGVELIGEPRVSTLPQRNIDIQPKLIAVPVNGGSQQFFLPSSAQPNIITLSPALPPPGPPPKLIPASSVSNIPYQANNSTGNLAGNPPAVLVPMVPDPSQKSNAVPNGAVTVQFDVKGELAKMRRKRKKMDDTTSFRDPPEKSLPFNGPNKYRFYCDVCDTGFTRRYTFNRHRCKGKVEKHYCQLCDKAYLSKYKLKDHILVKHEGQTVSCPDCGKRFSSRSSMEMHKKQQHEGQFSIFCKICGKGFNHTGHYYGHMNKHTNTKPFWCQKCGKRFYGSSYLHNHKQVCRGEEDWNHQCSICERKFKCELYLKKHMKVHDPTPIYQQSLDSNQNEVTTIVEGNEQENHKAEEVPVMADSSKLGVLNSVFHKNDQVQEAVV